MDVVEAPPGVVGTEAEQTLVEPVGDVIDDARVERVREVVDAAE